jgi:hypothetical protein
MKFKIKTAVKYFFIIFFINIMLLGVIYSVNPAYAYSGMFLIISFILSIAAFIFGGLKKEK